MCICTIHRELLVSPRHKKPRVCRCPRRGRAFKPAGIPLEEMENIILHRDELEALKLCDLDDFTQEEAGERMSVSRGTVQRLLSSARKKTAMALSEYKAIVFETTTSEKEK